MSTLVLLGVLVNNMAVVTKKRHVAKAITYRLISSVYTFFVSYALTNNLNLSLNIFLLDSIGKLVLYYGHERLWYKSKFGVRKC